MTFIPVPVTHSPCFPICVKILPLFLDIGLMSPGLGIIADRPPGLPYHPGHTTVPALTKPRGQCCLGWLDHVLVVSGTLSHSSL